MENIFLIVNHILRNTVAESLGKRVEDKLTLCQFVSIFKILLCIFTPSVHFSNTSPPPLFFSSLFLSLLFLLLPLSLSFPALVSLPLNHIFTPYLSHSNILTLKHMRT